MRKMISARIELLLVALGVTAGWGAVAPTMVLAREAAKTDIKAEFLRLCDVASEQLNTEARRVAFYHDSYAVRALAVAYDMTAKKEYLDVCKRWSDRMVAFQNGMTPKGAYYMNYGRNPGQNQGDWYSADSSSIAMGVLATAVRCTDQADKDRYLDSVKSFARLVMDNYVGPAGGITDGLWSRYDGEWWCCSGVFGSLAFLLYEETGDEQYLKVALGALDWLNRLDYTRVKHISFEDAAPSVIMYILEAYSAGMQRLEAGSERRKAALAQISKTLQWMSKNQATRAEKCPWDYNSQWGSKLGGMPFHMYVYSKHLPEGKEVRSAADLELRHIGGLLAGKDKPRLSQLMVFSMMSYAERLAPGRLFRKSGKL